MPEVIARQVFEYERRTYAPGDRLHVEDRFVALLVHIGRIHPPAADSSGTPYRTTAIASAPNVKADEPAQKQKRHRQSIVGNTRA